MATAPDGAATAPRQAKGLVERARPQGGWLDADGLRLPDRSRSLVEPTDGYLEILPMPTGAQRRIPAFLHAAFRGFLKPAGGALFAPLRLRIRPAKFRAPDLMAVRDARGSRSGDRFWTGADVVVEVVSPDHPERDFIDKREDCAEASIPEYWIVDPATETISVLGLEPRGYVQQAGCGRRQQAASVQLAGLTSMSAACSMWRPETDARGRRAMLRPFGTGGGHMWHLLEDFLEQSLAMKIFVLWGWLSIALMVSSCIASLPALFAAG